MIPRHDSIAEYARCQQFVREIQKSREGNGGRNGEGSVVRWQAWGEAVMAAELVVRTSGIRPAKDPDSPIPGGGLNAEDAAGRRGWMSHGQGGRRDGTHATTQ